MYTKKVPFVDYKHNPRNIEVNFNLEEYEVFKLLVEFQAIFEWQESIKGQNVRELPTEDVMRFFTHLEEIILSAWGVPSDDGLYFRKSGRYDFEDSKLRSAVMNMFLEDPQEANKLIDGLMPKGLQDMVKKADANMAAMAKDPNTEEDLRREIDRLRAQVAPAE